MLPVDYNDRQKKKTYIFFDFECTHDDRIQCQQGYQSDDNGKCIHCKSPRCGAFEHIPNICVVHRVCLKCIDQGVDKESICQICGKWLFSGENEGASVIAHNFKGYDSLPILGYLYQKRCETNDYSQWCQEHVYRSIRMSCENDRLHQLFTYRIIETT
jgi:hypothetical protein